MEFLVGIPKWASYNDLVRIVEKCISNVKDKEASSFDGDMGDYIVRFLETTKLKCIFCQC
jgi:hypothetical protein